MAASPLRYSVRDGALSSRHALESIHGADSGSVPAWPPRGFSVQLLARGKNRAGLVEIGAGGALRGSRFLNTCEQS